MPSFFMKAGKLHEKAAKKRIFAEMTYWKDMVFFKNGFMGRGSSANDET